MPWYSQPGSVAYDLIEAHPCIKSLRSMDHRANLLTLRLANVIRQRGRECGKLFGGQTLLYFQELEQSSDQPLYDVDHLVLLLFVHVLPQKHRLRFLWSLCHLR